MKRMLRVISAIIVFSVLLSSVAVGADSFDAVPELLEYGFVDCGDALIEYGIYGQTDGKPLLLLPPNGGDMHSLDDSVLPELSKHYKVITVSPRGTGKSDWVEGTMNFETMSEDIKKLLDHLKVEKTSIFGFSDGGNLGIVFTLTHQDRVEALAIMGSNINTWGTKTFTQMQITYQYIILCIEAWLYGDDETARRRDIKGMMVGQPSLTFDDISEIKVPVLNIFGEHDMIKRSHSKRITRSIQGAKELMIIGGGHSTCFEFTEEIINPALIDFFG